jgi:hypothetical protein
MESKPGATSLENVRTTFSFTNVTKKRAVSRGATDGPCRNVEIGFGKGNSRDDRTVIAAIVCAIETLS